MEDHPRCPAHPPPHHHWRPRRTPSRNQRRLRPSLEPSHPQLPGEGIVPVKEQAVKFNFGTDTSSACARPPRSPPTRRRTPRSRSPRPRSRRSSARRWTSSSTAGCACPPRNAPRRRRSSTSRLRPGTVALASVEGDLPAGVAKCITAAANKWTFPSADAGCEIDHGISLNARPTPSADQRRRRGLPLGQVVTYQIHQVRLRRATASRKDRIGGRVTGQVDLVQEEARMQRMWKLAVLTAAALGVAACSGNKTTSSSDQPGKPIAKASRRTCRKGSTSGSPTARQGAAV